VRLLTPTENKRLNELVGFLCIIVAVLLAAALISYSPRDAAFNVSRQVSDGGAVGNWIGPIGAYSADLLFQVFGFAAFLLPMASLGLAGGGFAAARSILNGRQWPDMDSCSYRFLPCWHFVISRRCGERFLRADLRDR